MQGFDAFEGVFSKDYKTVDNRMYCWYKEGTDFFINERPNDLTNERTTMKAFEFKRGTTEELRLLRQKAGLTKAEASRLSGVPYSTWNGWELNTSNAITPPALAISWLSLYIKYKQFVDFFPNSAKENDATTDMQRGGE
jgi:DNA-binding transcriptional regulator YiaG